MKNQRPLTQRAQQNSRNFGKIMFFLLVLLFCLISGRFLYVSTVKKVEGHKLSDVAAKVFMAQQTVPARRGTIFDTSGTPLAENSTTYNLYAVLDKGQVLNGKPAYVTDLDETAHQLSKVIDLSEQKIYRVLLKGKQKESFQVEFGNAGKNLSVGKYHKIEKMKLKGIGFTTNASRSYPNGIFASHLIGFAQNKANRTTRQTSLTGMMGTERAQNKFLAGQSGLRSLQNVGAQTAQGATVKNGDDVYLTLDSKLQLLMENQVEAVYGKMEPKWVVAVMMNAKTGEVLAATQRPTFNGTTLNGIDKMWSNLLVEDPFEPGSVIKGITLSAAIDQGNWNSKKSFMSGRMTIGDQVITDFDKTLGEITFKEGFAHSSNVAFAMQEQKMGAKNWEKYLRRFGFLKTTHFGLSNEAAGSMQFTYPIEQANTAFGQGIRVTPIQLMQAYSAIANNGKMIRPYYVKKVVDPTNNRVLKSGKTVVTGHPIKASTAKKVRKLMVSVVDMKGATATDFSLRDKGYEVAAKSGTAQIAKQGGGYTNDYLHSIHSIMTLVPAKDPQYMFYMAINTPTGLGDGVGKEQNSVFRPLMLQALNNSDAAIKNKTSLSTVPKLTGKTVSAATAAAKANDYSIVVIGSGKGAITAQSLPPRQQAIGGQKIFVVTDGDIKIPDMTGWSLLDARSFARYSGIKLSFTGSGFVAKQSQKPNQIVKKGMKLKVTLK